MTRLSWLGAALLAGMMSVGCGGGNKAPVTPDDTKTEEAVPTDETTTEETAPDEGTESPEKEGEDDSANPCGGY